MSADLLLLLYHKFGKSQRLFAQFAQFRYVVIIQNIFFVQLVQNALIIIIYINLTK